MPAYLFVKVCWACVGSKSLLVVMRLASPPRCASHALHFVPKVAGGVAMFF